MKELQLEVAEEAVFKDENDLEKHRNLTVIGIDQAFTDDKSITAAVVYNHDEVIDTYYGEAELEIPYIPGLLAFREGGSIIDALQEVDEKPDLLMLDGSGRIHFRQAGIATHIGVVFDIPSIGIAKNLLCGKVDIQDNMEEGESKEVISDNSIANISDEEVIGYAYQSKQYESSNRKINPIYVSPGHRVSETTSVDIVSEFCDGYKLPEPIRIADSKVDVIKNESF